MKKLTAILLFTLFLFNLVGYRFVFSYAQQQSDTQLQANFDNNQYNDEDLITIRVPLSMPYQTLQSNFERVDGEITVDGKIYKYVKRKIVDGEMVLMCLPDQQKMHLESARNDFFKMANDVAQTNSSKKQDGSKASVFKNLVSEYIQHVSACSSQQVAIISLAYNNQQTAGLLTLPHTPPAQPPDFI